MIGDVYQPPKNFPGGTDPSPEIKIVMNGHEAARLLRELRAQCLPTETVKNLTSILARCTEDHAGEGIYGLGSVTAVDRLFRATSWSVGPTVTGSGVAIRILWSEMRPAAKGYTVVDRDQEFRLLGPEAVVLGRKIKAAGVLTL